MRGNWPFLTAPNVRQAQDEKTAWERAEERERLARENAKRMPRHGAPVTEVNIPAQRTSNGGSAHYFRAFDPRELKRP